MKQVNEIIGKKGEKYLRQDINEALSLEGTTYSDIEEIMLDYGLEMDYFEQLIF